MSFELQLKYQILLEWKFNYYFIYIRHQLGYKYTKSVHYIIIMIIKIAARRKSNAGLQIYEVQYTHDIQSDKDIPGTFAAQANATWWKR